MHRTRRQADQFFGRSRFGHSRRQSGAGGKSRPAGQTAGRGALILRWPLRVRQRLSRSESLLLHDQPRALFLADVELLRGSGFGRLAMRRLDESEKLDAVPDGQDAPGAELGGAGLHDGHPAPLRRGALFGAPAKKAPTEPGLQLPL